MADSDKHITYKSKYPDSSPPEKYGGLVSNLFWDKLDEYADKYMFIDYPTKRKWKAMEIKDIASKVARYCVDTLELKQEFRSVLIYDSDDYLQIFSLGIIFAGGSVCVGATQDPIDEHSYMIELIKPNLVGVPRALIDRMNIIRSNLKMDFAIIQLDDANSPDIDGIAGVTFFLKDMLPYQEESTKLPVQVKPSSPVYFLLTSGSTGRPKPVARTQENSLYVCYSVVDETDELWGFKKDSVLAGHLPLDHGTGTFNLEISIYRGYPLVLMPKFQDSQFMKAVDEYKITDCLLGSALMHNFLGACELATTSTYTPLATLRNMLSIGSPIPCFNTVDKFLDKHPNLSIRQAYGSTECGFISIVSRNETRTDRETLGYLLPNFSLRIVDHDDLTDIKVPNEFGELLVKGPTVSPGYFGAEYAEQTEQVFLSSGYYRTDDIGRLLPDCRLQLKGRFSNVLCLYDGWKVLPGDIESVLLLHPDIEEVAVVGIPHPIYKTCHATRAYVVPKSGKHLKPSDVIAHSAERLSEYKHIGIGGVVIMDKPLPRLLLGKVDKKALLNNTDFEVVTDSAYPSNSS